MYYAQITNGVVTAVTETAAPIDAANMIAIDSLDASLLGQSYAAGVFTPAPAPTVPWTKKDFLLKFTPTEYSAIKAATLVDATLDYYWSLFTVAQDVVKTDPVTIAGINALEAAGHLAVGRAAEILA